MDLRQTSRLGVEARMKANSRRADALVRLRSMAESGQGADALAWLLRECQSDPALLRLHIWRVSQAIYGTSDATARRQVARAAEWCRARDVDPATANLGWLLDERTKGARLSAWLLAVALDLGYRLPGPDPYDIQPASS